MYRWPVNRWVGALAALALLAVPAAAQKDRPAPATDDAPAAGQVSSPAEGVARSILIDSGIIDAAIQQAVAERFGQAREDFARNRVFRRLPAERQPAVLAVFDTLPNILREEIIVVMPNAVRAFAADLDREFEPGHLADIDTFMRSSAGQKLIRESMAIGLRANGRRPEGADAARAAIATMTDEEAGQTMRFATSEAGAAFAARTQSMLERLQRSMLAALTPALTPTMARMQTDLCAAMGPDCPPELRPARQDTP